MAPYILHGWHLSYFTAKIICYFRYKNIPFTMKYLNVFDLQYRIKKKVGASVMPVVLSPNNEWIQDTKNIIETIEPRFPEAPIIPVTPKRRFISHLLEAWGDEFWIPMAMHYRWNYDQCVKFFKNEAGDNLLPWAPRFLKDYAADKTASILIRYLPTVGVRPEQQDILEEWTLDILHLLEDHFTVHPYLLGNTPTIGDFGLAGPLVGHLGRDPWPMNNIIQKYPHVQDWIHRMQTVSHSSITLKSAVSDDTIPDTLIPILGCIFCEYLPMLQATVQPVEELYEIEKFAAGKNLPRALGDIEFPLGGRVYRRAALPFNLWKAQNVLDQYEDMSLSDKEILKNWLKSIPNNAAGFLDLQFRRLDRRVLHVCFAHL